MLQLMRIYAMIYAAYVILLCFVFGYINIPNRKALFSLPKLKFDAYCKTFLKAYLLTKAASKKC